MTDAPIALTFDAEHPDRPTEAGAIELILETLAEERAPATFFLQGRWVEANLDLAQRIAADGYLIGNHSHYHARMPLLTDDGFIEDVAEAERVIVAACGIDPRPYFRCPFGTGGHHPRTTELLERMGYRHFGWDVEVEDWEPRYSGDDLAAAVVEGVDRYGGGATVLLHTWPISTGRGLRKMIRELRAKGHELGTIADALAQ